MTKIIQRHTILVTMEVNQIDYDSKPEDWYWPGVIYDASDTFRTRGVKVLSVRNITDTEPDFDSE